jgi:hypothetical protein
LGFALDGLAKKSAKENGTKSSGANRVTKKPCARRHRNSPSCRVGSAEEPWAMCPLHPRHRLKPAMSISERRRIVGLPGNAEKSIWELADELGVCYETIRTDRTFLAKPASERSAVPEFVSEQPPDDPAPYDCSDSANHHARILKTAKRWFIDEGLDYSEVEWIIPKTAVRTTQLGAPQRHNAVARLIRHLDESLVEIRYRARLRFR